MNPKKAKWWNERAKALGGYATMESIHTNKAADIYYRKSATALLEAFLEATIKKIGKHYQSVYSFNAEKGKSPAKVGSALKTIREYDLEEFKKQAEKIAEKFTMKVGRLSKKNIQDTLERFYGGRIPVRYNTNYNEILKLIIKRNVALLTKTAQSTLDNVENIVYDAMTTGKGWADIQGALKTQQGIAQRRIKLIARDQTAKATEAVNILMQRAAGAEYFEWRTSKDERVSTGYGGHKQLDGKIYKYGEEDKYPIIDSYGHKGLPSQRPNCYHKETEVMTKDGFKLIKDVKVGEMIATINPETKQWEWKRCINTYNKYVDKIYEFSSAIFRLRVSKDHRFFYYKRKYDGKQKIKNSYYPVFTEGVESLSFGNTNFYATTDNWQGTPLGDYAGIPIDIFCKFMGYYLSDGNVDKRTDNAIHIANCDNEAMFQELKPYMRICQGKEKLFIYNKELFSLVAPLGYCNEKRIPEVIKNLPKEQIRVFLDAFASCDGSPARQRIGFQGISKGTVVLRRNEYYTTSYQMASDLVECIYKTGNSASIYVNRTKGKTQKFKNGEYTINHDIYVISELRNKVRSIRKGYKEVDYNDYVYDIEVEDNHTLLIKDGKSIHFNANCRCTALSVFIMDGYKPEWSNADECYRIVRV